MNAAELQKLMRGVAIGAAASCAAALLAVALLALYQRAARAK